MIVVVESTIFDRGIDTDLLQKVAHHKQFILRPLRSLAAFYQSSRELREPTFDAIKKSTILDSQAATYDNAKNVRDTLSEWNKPNYDKSIRDNANLAKTLVNELSQSHYLETIRNSLKDEFFERKGDRWLRLDYSGEELRWEDAIHLDERSAIIVSSLLEKALSENVPPGQRLHKK